MKSNYKKLGELIIECEIRNKNDLDLELWGVSIEKKFIKSVANIIGTDLTKYKVVKSKEFVCSLMQVSRDEKIPISMWDKENNIIVSPAYKTFRVKDNTIILPEFLNLWFKRNEFDREASYYGVGGVRGSLEWSDFCNMELPVPSIEEQKKIVKSYQAIENRISILRQINDNLEAAMKTLFRAWFVTFERFQGQIDDETNLPCGWRTGKLTELMDYVGGQQPPAEQFIFEPHDGYTRLVQIRDYETDKYATYIPISMKNKICEPLDVMIARYGVSLGRICYGLSGAYNVALAKVFPRKPFYREYLRCYLKTDDFYNGINGSGERSAQQGFNQDNMEDFEVVIPTDEVFKLFNIMVEPIVVKQLSIRNDIKYLSNLEETFLVQLSR